MDTKSKKRSAPAFGSCQRLIHFLDVVERGSISNSAYDKNMSSSTTHRAVAELEQGYGKKLLDRHANVSAKINRNGIEVLKIISTELKSLAKEVDKVARKASSELRERSVDVPSKTKKKTPMRD